MAIEAVGLLFSRVRNFGDWEIAHIPLHFRVSMCETKSLWSCGGLEFSWDCWHQELATPAARCYGALGSPWKEGWNGNGGLGLKQGLKKPHSSAKQRPPKGVSCSTLYKVPGMAFFEGTGFSPCLQSPISWENSRAVRKIVNIVMKGGKIIIAKTELLGQRWKRKPD